MDLKTRALYDYWAFIDLIGFHGGSANFGQCHRDMEEWSEENGKDKEVVLIPRGHLKSTLRTVGRALHRIYQNPNVRIFVGTATKELAQAFVREMKTYLEDPTLQDKVWNNRPHIQGRLVPVMDKLARQRRLETDETEAEDKKVLWRTDALQVLRSEVLKEPTVCVGAVGVQPTGFHYDELYLDDVVNYDNIATPDKLNKLKRWVKDLQSVLDLKRLDKGLYAALKRCKIPEGIAKRIAHIGSKVSVVGTRYAEEDWYNNLLTRERYAIYVKNIYKNGEDNSEGYLWDEIWNAEVEAEKYEEIDDPVVWSSQYLNKVIAAEEQVLNMGQIVMLHPMSVQQIEGTNRIRIQLPDEDKPVEVTLSLIIDPAATIGAKSDFTAMCVGGKDARKRLYVVDGALGKWKGEDLLKNLYKLADRWHLRACHIEAVGGFKHFTEYVKSHFFRYRPLVIHEFVPKGKKELRIANALEPLVRNQLLYMMLWMHSHKEIKTQINFFGQANIHDDFPDVVAALWEIAKPPNTGKVVHITEFVNKQYGGYR